MGGGVRSDDGCQGCLGAGVSEMQDQRGTDPKIVRTNWQNSNHGAIAVSDNGAGTVVGWAFKTAGHITNVMGNPMKQAEAAALQDCQKKGGKNPKVVNSW